MAIVDVTRLAPATTFGRLFDVVALLLVVLAVPAGLLLAGAPLALLIKGLLALVARIAG